MQAYHERQIIKQSLIAAATASLLLGQDKSCAGPSSSLGDSSCCR